MADLSNDKAAHIVDTIAEAHNAGDFAQMRRHALALQNHIRQTGASISPDIGQKLLKIFKNARAFDQLCALAELLLQMGQDQPGISIFYAQGLIESGKMAAALSVLEPRLARARAMMTAGIRLDKDSDKYELEAIGLAGRAYKQSYVEFSRQAYLAKMPLPDAAKEFLRKAIEYYSAVLRSGSQSNDGWHEINYVALAILAERCRIIEPLSSGALQVAIALRERLVPGVGRAAAAGDPWPAGTVAEACLALGDWAGAKQYYRMFAEHEETEAFHLASAVRQLEEIWQLENQCGEAKQILQGLKAKLMTKRDGELVLPYGVSQSVGNDLGVAYQAMFGDTGPIPVSWFQNGLMRAKAVARIMVNNRALATGFLVPGRALSPLLDDKPYLLTNSHVLSDPKAHWKAWSPEAARVYFEEAHGTQPEQSFECKLVWQSRVDQLDASLLELHPEPPDLEPFELAQDNLQINGSAMNSDSAERVNIIGHPGADRLSISIQDNQIVDVGPRDLGDEDAIVYYHYKTPTRPGNSGSPVCYGDDWKVYALHHAGPQPMQGADGELENALPRLNGHKGVYEANEGISIISIKNQIHAELEMQRQAALEQGGDHNAGAPTLVRSGGHGSQSGFWPPAE